MATRQMKVYRAPRERLWNSNTLSALAESKALASHLRKAVDDLRWGPLSVALANFEVDMREHPEWIFRNQWNARHLASIGRIVLEAEEALRKVEAL